MNLRVNLHSQLYPVVFTDQAIEELTNRSSSFNKVIAMIEKNVEEIENVEVDQDVMIIDDMCFVVNKMPNEIIIKKIMKDLI